ncbi:hypothetical protein [Sphingomicrobium arenosum]|uniref:hypothetical protein n=1 Tax=Sphingomicrobium arenosum TaxID=2233861 RepID=UPI002240F920|nr:hypothetical protein [Sphingomicrobium arenosum]
MPSPFDFAVLLFACADGGAMCEPVATGQLAFQSQAACEATIDAALMRASDLDTPWIEAECRKIEAIPVALRTELGNFPEQSG